MYKFLCFVFFCTQINLFSNPSNPQVVSGSIESLLDNKILKIQTQTDKTIVNWQDFNIALDEKTIFLQPGNASFIINKVISQNPSSILGNLESNGRVLLLNENGILIGREAKINVDSFFASTLDLKNIDDFDKDLLFEGSSNATIVHLGKINSKADVYLISKHIKNDGLITCKNEANLISASKVLIKPFEEDNIFIMPGEKNSKSDIGIDQTGSIQAEKTKLLSDGNIYEKAIKFSGKIQSHSVEKKGSEVYLIAKNGVIQTQKDAKIEAVNNESGGKITILADDIRIEDNTNLDVSSINGGGKIYIGGGLEGKDPDLFNSNNTFLSKDSLINASAVEKGSAGQVIVFSDGTTQFYGSINANGGVHKGDGGFVEVSGKQNLIFEGSVDTKAKNGNIGTLLLDPINITISLAADAGTGGFDGGTPINTFTPGLPPSPNNILNITLAAALDAANVVINTSGGGGGDPGNISFTAAFAYVSGGAAGGGLTLNADNDILVSATVSFTFDAGSSADVAFNAAHDIIFGTGAAAIAFTLTNNDQVTFAAANDFTINNETTLSVTAANSCQITSGGTFFVDNSAAIAPGEPGLLNLTVANTSTISAPLVRVLGKVDNLTSGSLSITSTATDIEIGPSTNTFGTATDTDHISYIQTGGAATLNLTSARDVIMLAGSTDGFQHAQILSTGGDINITATNVTLTGGSGAAGDQTALIRNFGGDTVIIATNNVTLQGGTGVTAAGDVHNAQIQNSGGDTTITASNNISLLGGAGNDTSCFAEIFSSSGDINLSSTNDLILTGGTATAAGGTNHFARIDSVTGDIHLVVGNDLTMTGGSGAAFNFAQIGKNNTTTGGAVDSDIYLTVGGDVTLTSGFTSDCYCLIGHGSSAGFFDGTMSGDIIINSIGGDCVLDAKTNSTIECFCVIGHSAMDDNEDILLIGDIRGASAGSYANIRGELKIKAGDATQAQAFFGHGGSNITSAGIVGSVTMEGNIMVHADRIEIEGGDAQDAVAGIGFRGRIGGGTPSLSVRNASVKVSTDGFINMLAGAGSGADAGAAFIGAILNQGGFVAATDLNIVLDIVDVSCGTVMTMLGGITNPSENPVLVGAFNANFNTDPPTPVGKARTKINVYSGENLSMISRNGDKCYIFNGNGNTAAEAAGNYLNVTTGRDLFMMAESKGVTITSIDTATIYAGHNISVFSDEEGTNITAANDLYVEAIKDINLIGHCTGAAFTNGAIQTTAGTLRALAGRDVKMGPFALIDNTGGGNVFVVCDNAYPNAGEIGPGSLFMDAHSDIRASGGGLVRIFTASRPLNFIYNFKGNPPTSTFINAAINNTVYIAGTLYVDTATERWSTYYPSSIGGTPYTIFYKDGPVSDTLLVLIRNNPNIIWPDYELFYKPFYVYLYYDPFIRHTKQRKVDWNEVFNEVNEYQKKKKTLL